MRVWWRKWLRMRRPSRALDPLEKAGWVCFAGYLLFASAAIVFYQTGALERVLKGSTPQGMIAWVGGALIARTMWPFVSVMFLALGARRFKRRLRAARFALCPRCLYDLRGLRGEAACPECGGAIPAKGAVSVWREKFPNRKRLRARGPWWKYAGVGIGR